ncbi:polyprenyl diphosphate synthase [Stackebrandtia endophytica]|nr:polyprenyl diphosphate synthase [Stackebrandtia endophytica]
MPTFARSTMYRLYAALLRRQLKHAVLPGHIALVMDGNRRWARQMGFDNPSIGHRYGAEHVEDALAWCTEFDIRHVSVFVASTDNLHKRGTDEIAHLMRMLEEVVTQRLCKVGSPWRVHLAGRLDSLPDSTRAALKNARETTAEHDTGFNVTIVVDYDGHNEIVDAVRSLLESSHRTGRGPAETADRITETDIADHLYTRGLPDPDLIIRTSGEQRMSGFLLWQSARAELYFCDTYWPGFRRIDFMRALRTFSQRTKRRLSGA